MLAVKNWTVFLFFLWATLYWIKRMDGTSETWFLRRNLIPDVGAPFCLHVVAQRPVKVGQKLPKKEFLQQSNSSSHYTTIMDIRTEEMLVK